MALTWCYGLPVTLPGNPLHSLRSVPTPVVSRADTFENPYSRNAHRAHHRNDVKMAADVKNILPVAFCELTRTKTLINKKVHAGLRKYVFFSSLFVVL